METLCYYRLIYLKTGVSKLIWSTETYSEIGKYA